MPLVSVQDVLKHRNSPILWLVVDNTVYDLTDFAPTHPGGDAIIRRHAGRDATAAYRQVHALSLIRTALSPEKLIGTLDTSQPFPAAWLEPLAPSSPSPSPSHSLPHLPKPPLHSLISTHDFEAAAALAYSPKAWAFLSSAATDLHTKRRNASAYADIGLRPRVLRNVASVSTQTCVLGRPARAPIFCSPTSLGLMFHPDGEKAIGRACASLGLPQCVSTSASFPLPDVVAAVRRAEKNNPDNDNGIPIFFQLYVDKNRAQSTALLREAVGLGIAAIFLTVDAPVPGKREADERIASDEGVSAPMTGTRAQNDAKGGALGRIMGGYIDATVTWDDIAWLRETCPGVPIVLKGIQTAEDALQAAELGVDGILLSNHGGRSLDTAAASICVLLELRRCCPEVFGKMEVFVDGGITRGTDIFKALCLGATAVGIGRGFVYGLAYGEEGVEKYIEILIDELETTMKNCGVTSLDQVHPGYVNTLALDPLVPGSVAQYTAKPTKTYHKL